MCIIYVHIYSYMDINVCYTHACIYMYIHTTFFISPHRRMPLFVTCHSDLWIFFAPCCLLP